MCEHSLAVDKDDNSKNLTDSQSISHAAFLPVFGQSERLFHGKEKASVHPQGIRENTHNTRTKATMNLT